MLSTYLPATAQVAAQKAKHLARIMNGEMENEEERRFRHKNMGSMASIGGGKAIVSLSFSRLIPPDYLKSNRALNYQPKGSPVLAVFDWRSPLASTDRHAKRFDEWKSSICSLAWCLHHDGYELEKQISVTYQLDFRLDVW